jgi:hypothetical protein
MKLICITNNVPDTVYEMLNDLEYTSITFQEINKKSPAKLKTDAIFILTYSDFKANLETLNSEAYEKKTVFLFAPIVRVKYLTHAYFLDLVKDKGKNYSMTSEYKNLSLETLDGYLKKPFKSGRKIKEDEKEFRYHLIEGVRAGSLLNPLMTLLYVVKAEAGVKIKELVLDWLVSKNKIEVLDKKLKNSYQWGVVSNKFCEKLIQLLESDLGKKYKLAFTEIEIAKEAGEKSVIPAVAKKYDIDAYELKYIVNNMLKVRKNKLDGKSITEIHKEMMQKKKVEPGVEPEESR